MIIYLGIGLIFALCVFRMAEIAYVKRGKEDEDFTEIISSKILTIGIFVMFIVAWPYWLIRLVSKIVKCVSKIES